MRVEGHRTWFLSIMGLLIAAAWLTLVIWDHSPYGRYLEHGDWTRAGLAAAICQQLPAGNWLLPASLYAGGWALMCAAMMLPTTLPLLQIFRRLTRTRGDRVALLVLVIAGYMAAWMGFGVIAHALDWGVHEIAQSSTFLTFNGWVLGAGVLAVAGLYQFLPFKDFCLERCRLPLGSVLRHWDRNRPGRSALRLGLDHGVFCLGCCWMIMLLMFVVGTGSVAWMLGLGAVMAAEKNLPWGRHLAPPLGTALVAGSVIMVGSNVFAGAG